MVSRNFIFLVTLAIWLMSVGTGRAGRLNQQTGSNDDVITRMLKGDNPEIQGQQPLGTRWAVLVAGSNGYGNYRHQADVCHAYQILKKGGLKDENIVVFMYDDIAKNEENPKPGVIINHPKGHDVYAGVPKDYTGKHVTANNLYAVLLGNKTGLSGGSRKVVNSKPNDRIFLFYADHGAPGTLGMPSGPNLYAKDFIKVLKKKYASRSYKEMVIYIEACESGSIVEGLLPANMNIYVTTASNAEENSWGTYCPGMNPPPPSEYDTCLGDLYSISWMEDSDAYNRQKETLKLQYQTVKKRTSQNDTFEEGSHVMEYGDKTISAENLDAFQGNDPNSKNIHPKKVAIIDNSSPKEAVHQRDADMHFLWHKYKNANDGSAAKRETLKQITDTMIHRNHLDGSVKLIGLLLFGPRKSGSILNAVRTPGSPLVDDWECLKSMVRLFETHCGSLTKYGMQHTRAFANLCNNGVSKVAMEEASMAACGGHAMGQYDPSILGYSA